MVKAMPLYAVEVTYAGTAIAYIKADDEGTARQIAQSCDNVFELSAEAQDMEPIKAKSLNVLNVQDVKE